MIWRRVTRCDPHGRAIADRHYNRQSVGADNYAPPGSCLVLHAPMAVWVTSWPFKQFTKHAWAGAWVCSTFRREGGDTTASEMIRQAVACTRAYYGQPPSLGMVTFIDRSIVPPLRTRKGDVWGYTYRKAGFREVGETKGGLLALQLLPDAMPEPEYAIGDGPSLFSGLVHINR